MPAALANTVAAPEREPPCPLESTEGEAGHGLREAGPGYA